MCIACVEYAGHHLQQPAALIRSLLYSYCQIFILRVFSHQRIHNLLPYTEHVTNMGSCTLAFKCRFIQDLESRNIDVIHADERIAALWENCRAAQEEFPEQSTIVRRAIALGRLALDPLAVLAQLCGPRKEILSVKLTEMQEVLQPEERLKAIEQMMVTAVAQVSQSEIM